MTVRTLKITEQRHMGRRLVIINGHKIWLTHKCVDFILALSHADCYIEDTVLDAAPKNLARYVYKWHKDIEKTGLVLKLFENNKHHGWKLTFPVANLRYETVPGGVAIQSQAQRS